MDIQIVSAGNENYTEFTAIDLKQNRQIWSKLYKYGMMGADIVGDNVVFTSSSGKEADQESVMFIHSLKKSNLILSKEFSPDFPTQRVLISVIENVNNTSLAKPSPSFDNARSK